MFLLRSLAGFCVVASALSFNVPSSLPRSASSRAAASRSAGICMVVKKKDSYDITGRLHILLLVPRHSTSALITWTYSLFPVKMAFSSHEKLQLDIIVCMGSHARFGDTTCLSFVFPGPTNVFQRVPSKNPCFVHDNIASFRVYAYGGCVSESLSSERRILVIFLLFQSFLAMVSALKSSLERLPHARCALLLS
jgi:hypothetical protein